MDIEKALPEIIEKLYSYSGDEANLSMLTTIQIWKAVTEHSGLKCTVHDVYVILTALGFQAILAGDQAVWKCYKNKSF